MRHPSFILCASIVACGYASLATATNPPLAFTLDLFGSCTQGSCTGHPTDIGLNAVANTFSYAPGAGGSYVATMATNSPAVCDEVASDGTLGAKSSLRLAPTFSNSTGGLLEFNAGGASIVDAGAIIFDGNTPPGVAVSYSNSGGTTPQVVCYQINPISGGPVAYSAGPGGIFSGSFEGHPDPWVSVQTVNSPSTGLSRPSGQTSMATPANDMVYVVQIHNPVVGWHLDFGDDTAYFGMVNNGSVPANWCVLTSAQPGPLTSCGTGWPVTTKPNYTVAQSDIQTATNSVYLQVVLAGSSAATSSWSMLTSAFYPAVASVFPPYNTYPQRFDDKVAVASANNLPTLNIGSIVCNNDTSLTPCTILDQDGNSVSAQMKYQNAMTSGGAVTVDPLAYFVDPMGGTTLPGNAAIDSLTVSDVSCSDPGSILVSIPSGSNFTTSTGALGALAFGFSFARSSSPDYPYVGGTAYCSATFSTTGYAPALSRTQSFAITMQQASVASVAFSAAPAGQTAIPGGNLTYSLVVANAAGAKLNNVAVSDPKPANVQSVSWTCTSAGGASCPAASGSSALNQTIPSLAAGGSLTYAIIETVAMNPNPAGKVTNTASISVPGGSCSGGSCTNSVDVATAPIIAITMSEGEPTYHTNDQIAYHVTLKNNGGTVATGLTLADPAFSGVTIISWQCIATGTNSLCPNATGVGNINESGVAIDAGGYVNYYMVGAVISTGGAITNTTTVSGFNNGAICANSANPCSVSVIMTPAP